MTWEYIDGFELQDYNQRFATANTSGVVTGRFGYGKALSLATYPRNCQLMFPAAAAQVWVGFACYPTNVAAAAADVVVLCGDGLSTSHIGIYANEPGTWFVRRGSTTIGTFPALPQGVWSYVELTATIHDTTGTVEVRVNSETVFTFTGDTKNGGTSTNYSGAYFGCGGYPYIDDLYVNDFGFRGDVRVQTLVPNGAGSSTDFTPTGAANYANVADIPDSTGTFNAAATPGDLDLYAVGDLLADTLVVHSVQAVTHSWKSDAGAASLKAALKSGATTSYGATVPLPSSMDAQVDGWLTDPNTSAAWTPAAVNAAEVGAEVV